MNVKIVLGTLARGVSNCHAKLAVICMEKPVHRYRSNIYVHKLCDLNLLVRSYPYSMPYILIRGNLASYGHKNPWRVLVSGLKAGEIEQLKRFTCGGYCDDSTIVYLQHPCVILSALEVLGYKVVASSSTAVKQDYNEYMWTMRKEFSEPEPSIIVEQDNYTNFNKEAMHLGNYQTSTKDDEV